MSLVIARPLHPQRLTFLSDTKLTSNDVSLPVTEGCAKLIIVRKNLCIGFAGVVNVANDSIAKIPDSATFDDVVSHLHLAHNLCECRTDFLVADTFGRLVVIKEGRACETPAAWIGDADAFRDFQGRIDDMQRNPQYQPSNSYGRAWHAFEQLVSSEAHDTVGHFVLEVMINPAAEFRYRHRMQTYQERLPPLPLGESVFIDWGTLETGSFRMNTYDAAIQEDVTGRRILILFFPLINYGFVYLPQDGKGVPTPRVVRGDRKTFVDECHSLFSLDLK